MLATSPTDCQGGATPFCCATNVTNNCEVEGKATATCQSSGTTKQRSPESCGSNPTCSGNSSLLVTTLVGGYSQGSIGTSKPFCCDGDDFPYENCSWVGTPPLCEYPHNHDNIKQADDACRIPGLDNGCAVGQVTLITDVQGDANQPCVGYGMRSYCCDPIGALFRCLF